MFVSEKHCGRCSTTKAAGEFYNNARHRDRLSTYCRSCTDAIRPQYTKDERRDFHYKAEFGMTLDDYNRMLAEQGGVCAICETSTPGHEKIDHFSVDHCHVTGAIRGLLCERCNRGLGHYDDNPDRLETAARYLRKHRDDHARSNH